MEKLYKIISDVQANLFLLFHKTWVYHWNVVGSDFHQLHTLFGEQYTTMFEEIDRLSEHMRYLNIRPVGTLTRIVEVSSIGEGSNMVEYDQEGQKIVIEGTPVLKSSDMIRRLMLDNILLIQLLSNVSEEAELNKQYATANLAQDLMESHGKFVWMLRSFIEKTSTLSIEDTEDSPIEATEDFEPASEEVEEILEEIIEESIED